MFGSLDMVEATCVEVSLHDRLVGCGLAFMDQGAHMTTAFGMADDVPNVYFQLIYASLKDAFERRATALHWGSGAYETKRRLGFELEENSLVVLHGNGRLPGLLARTAAHFI